ncbi:isovaleryl-CoA dehydrogenase, mitochondrial-like [Neocloeon triangulifer]|uniref:isovaleryl-CoA dehydrogenase, mitochondrial-like n=1 Tax=Neocloeon triangulifer TaxID=2078957 RepID=UPI00286F9714|nr:isovaleryl-CoA dehydrogenase, mitochondrial-like [Neocloeon triangulifer]
MFAMFLATKNIRVAFVVRCRFTLNLKRCFSNFSPIDEKVFGLSIKQQQLRQTVFNFLQEELAPKADAIDEKSDFPELREFWKKLGKLGLLGITASSKYGGSDCSVLEHCIVMEEMARVSGGISLSYGAHSNLCVSAINKHCTDKQKEQFLPKLCSGEHMGAMAMSEPEAGSDVVSMRLRAEKKGDYFVLNGTKFWITNGPDADTLVVFAKSNPNAAKPQHGVTAFLIERGMEGFTNGKKLDKLGIRGSNTGELIFDNCKVPVKNILGGENKGIYVLFGGVDLERVVFAAAPVGVMQACCDAAFQQPSEDLLLQAKKADMFTTLSASRSYLYSVARACDQGSVSRRECASVALHCSEQATQLALQAIQCVGDIGRTVRYLRDAKLYEIGGGTSEVRRLVIGRSLNELYL